jgi:hypothetical protein
MRRTLPDTSHVLRTHGLSLATETRFPGHPLTSSKDERFLEQVAALRKLEATLLQPGVDLTARWREIVSHPELLEWLRQSDQVADAIKGRRDLVKKRRRGILRWLEGPDTGMPFHFPVTFVAPESVLDRELRLFRLRDELEYVVIPFFRSVAPLAPGPRPVRDTLTHQMVRAVLDWKASHLDSWLHMYPHLIGGRIYHPIPAAARPALDARAHAKGKEIVQPRHFLTEVRFDTTRFMAWYYANMN